MTYLVERLAEMRSHLKHLIELRPRAPERTALERDMSLRNDVLFSLLMLSQLLIDVAGELSARRAERFEDYTEAIRNLSRDPRFPSDLVRALEPLPGFRDVLIHEYVALDMDRVVEALRQLDIFERFIGIAAEIEAREQQ